MPIPPGLGGGNSDLAVAHLCCTRARATRRQFLLVFLSKGKNQTRVVELS